MNRVDPDLLDFVAYQRDALLLSRKAQRDICEVLLTLSVLLGKPLHDATADDIRRWQVRCLAKMPDHMRKRYVTTVRSFFGWAHERNIVGKDPSEPLRRPTVNDLGLLRRR